MTRRMVVFWWWPRARATTGADEPAATVEESRHKPARDVCHGKRGTTLGDQHEPGRSGMGFEPVPAAPEVPWYSDHLLSGGSYTNRSP
ncbi:hypothetical protein ACFYT4_16130 [Streptomyces sp. NPDC004609]|uniref:hypothetical protein n=1 Tax=Streptomyces sp. NPDC004609 TaxID=3364704 RepID=UPI0036975FBB